MKTLYLHIGTPKTATSAIQKFLADNREALREDGYCYPDSLHRYPDVHIRRNGHFLVGTVVSEDGKREKEKEAAYFEAGLQNVAACFVKYENVVLSDESIWRAVSYTRKTLFSQLKEEADKNNYKIKVIVYLRRQDTFVLSLWNQKVKHNSSPSSSLRCEDYIANALQKDKRMFAYGKKLDEIAEVIGKENLIVRRFAPYDWKDGSVIHDFMQAIGLDVTDAYHEDEEPVNLRLNKNETEIKRILNGCPEFSKKELAYMENVLREISAEYAEEPKTSMLTAAQRQQFLETYAAENMWAAEYIGDGKPLFSTEIEDLPKWSASNDGMTESVIRFFSALFMELRRENERQEAELLRLRRENERQTVEIEKLQDDVAMLRRFRIKVKHPFRTVLNRLLHRA